jgi:hypothetical protein
MRMLVAGGGSDREREGGCKHDSARAAAVVGVRDAGGSEVADAKKARLRCAGPGRVRCPMMVCSAGV